MNTTATHMPTDPNEFWQFLEGEFPEKIDVSDDDRTLAIDTIFQNVRLAAPHCRNGEEMTMERSFEIAGEKNCVDLATVSELVGANKMHEMTKEITEHYCEEVVVGGKTIPLSVLYEGFMDQPNAPNMLKITGDERLRDGSYFHFCAVLENIMKPLVSDISPRDII